VRTGGHSIAEIVLHCAYWKYTLRRRIRGDKRGSFPLKGSNWFAVPAKLSKQQWRDYVAILDEEHRAMREAIFATPDSRLFGASGSKPELATYVYSIAMHDTYHAGQIRMTKGLYRRTREARRSL